MISNLGLIFQLGDRSSVFHSLPLFSWRCSELRSSFDEWKENTRRGSVQVASETSDALPPVSSWDQSLVLFGIVVFLFFLRLHDLTYQHEWDSWSNRKRNPPTGKSNSCAKFPGMFKKPYSDLVVFKWQSLENYENCSLFRNRGEGKKRIIDLN